MYDYTYLEGVGTQKRFGSGQPHGVETSEAMLRFASGELDLWRDNIEDV